MHILRRIIIFVAIPLIVIFNLFCLKQKMLFAFSSLILLALVLPGYLFSAALLRATVMSSWLLLLPFYIVALNRDWIDAASSLSAMTLVAIGLLIYKREFEKKKSLLERERVKEEERVKTISEEMRRLEKEEKAVQENELAILALFEITKEMSGSLTFNDIFAVFSRFLKENFSFFRCDLMLVDWIEDIPKSGGIYSVWKDESRKDEENSCDLNRLIKIFTNNNDEMLLNRERDADMMTKICVIPESVRTFFAMPLIKAKRVAAILTLEDLPENDIERFRILAMEFSLEIKKVLLYETVERLAVTDSLTGLYTRRYFFERLNEEAQRSKRYKFNLAFLIADIDDFKQINDMYGHLVGDVLLCEVGRIIKEGVREIDLVSRYGGEEFALLLPETDTDGALHVAERIRAKVAETVFKAYDERLKITISIGIAIYPKDAEKIKDLIDRSDRALYKAKREGKNVVYEYKKEYNRKNNI